MKEFDYAYYRERFHAKNQDDHYANNPEPVSFYEEEILHPRVSTEFGYELGIVIPFVYWHHLHGKLGSTSSCFDTKCLYPFSISHKELYPIRIGPCPWISESSYYFFPNSSFEKAELDYSKWIPPKYKELYKNNLIVYNKPVLTILNKYTDEWGHEPTNFISEEVLDTIFSILKEKYQIIYIRYKGESAPDENWWRSDHVIPTKKLFDYELINEKHPEVTTLYDLMKKFPILSYNEMQMRILANCDNFISVPGGTAIFTCYFAPRLLVANADCRDVVTGANSNSGWYSKLSGTDITISDTSSDLINKAIEFYL